MNNLDALKAFSNIYAKDDFDDFHKNIIKKLDEKIIEFGNIISNDLLNYYEKYFGEKSLYNYNKITFMVKVEINQGDLSNKVLNVNIRLSNGKGGFKESEYDLFYYCPEVSEINELKHNYEELLAGNEFSNENYNLIKFKYLLRLKNFLNAGFSKERTYLVVKDLKNMNYEDFSLDKNIFDKLIFKFLKNATFNNDN